jgi:hypothetical protein
MLRGTLNDPSNEDGYLILPELRGLRSALENLEVRVFDEFEDRWGLASETGTISARSASALRSPLPLLSQAPSQQLARMTLRGTVRAWALPFTRS